MILQDDCATSGCTMQQCLNGTLPVDSPISAPSTFSPGASSTCNATFAISCSSTFQSCVGNSVAENLCNCYGPYIFCTYDSGCITEDDLQRLVVSTLKSRSCPLLSIPEITWFLANKLRTTTRVFSGTVQFSYK